MKSDSNDITELKEQCLQENGDISHLTKYDYEEAMRQVQAHMEDYFCRELTDDELDELICGK